MRARRKTAWRENQALGGLVKTFLGCPWFRASLHPSMAPLNFCPVTIWIASTVQKIEFGKGTSKKSEQYVEKVEKRKRRKLKNKNMEKEV